MAYTRPSPTRKSSFGRDPDSAARPFSGQTKCLTENNQTVPQSTAPTSKGLYPRNSMISGICSRAGIALSLCQLLIAVGSTPSFVAQASTEMPRLTPSSKCSARVFSLRRYFSPKRLPRTCSHWCFCPQCHMAKRDGNVPQWDCCGRRPTCFASSQISAGLFPVTNLPAATLAMVCVTEPRFLILHPRAERNVLAVAAPTKLCPSAMSYFPLYRTKDPRRPHQEETARPWDAAKRCRNIIGVAQGTVMVWEGK